MSDYIVPASALSAGREAFVRCPRGRSATRAAIEVAVPLALAAELERIAETLHTSCRVDDLMATIEAGARNGVRNELLARVAELRSGVSGTGDQQ